MPETLTLNNGTVLEKSYGFTGDGSLYLYVTGKSLADVFGLLIDRLNTERILYVQMSGEMTLWRGYQKLISVRDEGGGLVTATLRKEEAE